MALVQDPDLLRLSSASSGATPTGEVFIDKNALTIELIAPIEIEFITIIKEEVCFGDESGTINLNPTGGSLPYIPEPD